MCDTEIMFHFTCFNVEDPHDPSVGLFNGELSIPGNLLRREVFDPIIDEVRKNVSFCFFGLVRPPLTPGCHTYVPAPSRSPN